MWHRFKWWFNRARRKLWVRPLVYTVVAVAAVAAAALADQVIDPDAVPPVARETLEDLLAIIAASMLTVSTLAVGSMIAAYNSASASATPRAFALVLTDDVTQTALSGFIGAFIFSIVALTAVKTEAYGPVGLFIGFSITAGIFALVIMLFLRWVDRIARLGRLGSTIDRVEHAAAAAIDQRRCNPALGGVPGHDLDAERLHVHADSIGYVQSINVAALQRLAEKLDTRIRVDALPGTFAAPGVPLATVSAIPSPDVSEDDVRAAVDDAFVIGDDRTFEEDPRFGLITMTEIAARALSPAVNDPGTAIDIIGTFVRLFARWAQPPAEVPDVRFDRVIVPPLSTDDMFDDAFTAIARDGAATVEVAIRLQKALSALASIDHDPTRRAAHRHAALALARAEHALTLPDDRERVRGVSAVQSSKFKVQS